MIFFLRPILGALCCWPLLHHCTAAISLMESYKLLSPDFEQCDNSSLTQVTQQLSKDPSRTTSFGATCRSIFSHTPAPYACRSCSSTCGAPHTSTVHATFDATYDNRSGSLNDVTYSNGASGLAARFPTFSNIPTFLFYRRCARRCIQLAQPRWMLETDQHDNGCIADHDPHRQRRVWFQPRTRGICNVERWANRTGRIRCGCRTSGSSYL